MFWTVFWERFQNSIFYKILHLISILCLLIVAVFSYGTIINISIIIAPILFSSYLLMFTTSPQQYLCSVMYNMGLKNSNSTFFLVIDEQITRARIIVCFWIFDYCTNFVFLTVRFCLWSKYKIFFSIKCERLCWMSKLKNGL